MSRILGEKRTQLFLERETLFLSNLRSFLLELGRLEMLDNVDDLIQGLNAPFTIVVVGEYNTGKSCFINALLGQNLLAEGVVPTTDQITVVRHSTDSAPLGEGHYLTVEAPKGILHDLRIIDTPGTNSIIQEHRDTTESFIHRAELILFLISAIQPFSESERNFLDFVRGRWDRKVVFILNKIDLLAAGELPTVRDYVEKNAYKCLEFDPLLFEISAQQALQGKLSAASRDELEDTGLPAIENYILKTLSSDEKLLLKLRSPLKAAEHLCDEISGTLQGQIKSLRADEGKIEDLFLQLAERKDELREFFAKYRAEIDRVFSELKIRVHRFVQEHLTSIELARMRIMGRSLEEEFRKEIVVGEGPLAGLPLIIDDAINYVSRNNHKLWEFSLAYVQERIVEARSYSASWHADFLGKRQ